MDVETAEAQLVLAKAGQEYRKAKAVYRADSDEKPAFVEARDVLLAARNDWRNNYRTAPDGPGDGTADPDPVSVVVAVKETE